MCVYVCICNRVLFCFLIEGELACIFKECSVRQLERGMIALKREASA